MQDVPCAPQRNVDLAVFGRELEGVGEQIAQHLMDVVGHEVHRHGLLHIQLQVDVSASRIFAVRIHYHRHIGGDAAVAPVQIAHLRLYLRDVEQLVDERQQSLALPFDGCSTLPHLLLGVFLQFLAQAENDCERSAELVGDVGEEVLAHP